MAPVADAISATSSGATKSARARPSPQSIEWPGPAMKPSSDIHRFTTTLPLMSRPPSLRHHRTSDLARADACETLARGVAVQIVPLIGAVGKCRSSTSTPTTTPGSSDRYDVRSRHDSAPAPRAGDARKWDTPGQLGSRPGTVVPLALVRDMWE